jgi:quinol monooxygenase YgiN
MSQEIYNIVKAKITTDDMKAFKAQAKRIVDAAQREYGTLFYDFLSMKKTKTS